MEEMNKGNMMDKMSSWTCSTCRGGIILLGILVVVVIAFVVLVGCGDYDDNKRGYGHDSRGGYSQTGMMNKSRAQQDAIAKQKVEGAIELVKELGRTQAFAYLNHKASIHEDWYVYIYNKSTGLEVVNPFKITPGDVREWVDYSGKRAGQEIYNAPANGYFIDYTFTAPTSGKDVVRKKKAWVKYSNGYIYGAGYYVN